MKKIIILMSILMLFLLSSCTTQQVNPFVTVNGTQFELAGKPYYFVGTNMWYGMYLGSTESGERDRLLQELDILKEHGITNLRICAASELAGFKHQVNPVVQAEPGVYDENLLDGLDFCLAEMAKRDMKAVLFLTNYWEWSGGISAYNQWAGEGDPVDPSEGDWMGLNRYVTKFYSGKKQQELFRTFIKTLIERKNNYTGLVYRDDPTIMSWQLANEPRPGAGELIETVAPHWATWIDETAAFIHSLDDNHLVSTGNEGMMGSGNTAENYLLGHKSEHVDYLTFHIWAKNWSWYKADQPEETYPVAEKNMIAYFEKHMQLAEQLGKPITLEEFGLGRDAESCDPQAATTYRDRYLTAVFRQIEKHAAQGAPIAGSNFWAWGGLGVAQHADYIWQEGDPYTGDPPQEPQGLNSVFAGDVSTMQILLDHAKNLQKMCE